MHSEADEGKFEEMLEQIKQSSQHASSTPKKTSSHKVDTRADVSDSDATLTSEVARKGQVIEQLKRKKFKCERHRRSKEDTSQKKDLKAEEKHKIDAKSQKQLENYVTSGMSHLSMSDVTEPEDESKKKTQEKRSTKSRETHGATKHKSASKSPRPNQTSSKQKPRAHREKSKQIVSDEQVRLRAKSASSLKKRRPKAVSPASSVSTLVRRYQ